MAEPAQNSIAMTHFDAGNSGVWPAVERLVERAPDLRDLRAHRLHLIAASLWEQQGRDVPADFRSARRRATVRWLTTPLVLERVRAAYDGDFIVMKGPEVAARYPDPLMRPYVDVDVLADDAERAQRKLIENGFRLAGDPSYYQGIHHLQPLIWPGLGLSLEVHSSPKWVSWSSPPPTEELLATAVPIAPAIAVDGVRVLASREHALVLAAHSWAHEPLNPMLELIDIAVIQEDVAAADLAAQADRWRIGVMWKTTAAVIDALFGESREPAVMRLWARNLKDARERLVVEKHLSRLTRDFFAQPWRDAVRETRRRLGRELALGRGEPWQAKAERTLLALRHARMRSSDHDREIAVRGIAHPNDRLLSHGGARKADL